MAVPETRNLVPLAPAHDVIAAESAVAADDDLYRRPRLADALCDPLDLRQCTGRCVYVAGPQAGAQYVLAAENVQWQETVIAVVAVKEGPQLIAMHRIIRRVQVQHDPRGRLALRRQKLLDQQVLDVPPSKRATNSRPSEG
ncbi:MAG TPA: hypothetical protein VH370_09030 [Humisphaera sp.]|nr:hypothetical protein [Humisphaera sp.]